MRSWLLLFVPVVSFAAGGQRTAPVVVARVPAVWSAPLATHLAGASLDVSGLPALVSILELKTTPKALAGKQGADLFRTAVAEAKTQAATSLSAVTAQVALAENAAQAATAVEALDALEATYAAFLSGEQTTQVAELRGRALSIARSLTEGLKSSEPEAVLSAASVHEGAGLVLSPNEPRDGRLTSFQEPPAPAAPAAPAGRGLGLLDMTVLGINAIIGAGIFLFPGKLFALTGPASIAVFAGTGILLVSIGLCFAAAGTYFKTSGGPYRYARAAFGENVAFGVGWMGWIAQMTGWAAVAGGLGGYLGYFHPFFAQPGVAKAVVAGFILLLGAVNYVGVTLGAKVSKFLTVAKLTPLAVLLAAGAHALLFKGAGAGAYTPFAPHGLSFTNLAPAVFAAFFAYGGFQYVGVPAGDVREPQKTVPRAVLASMLGILVLYVAIQTVAVGVVPNLATSERPLADAAGALLGPWGTGLLIGGAVFSILGHNSGAALITPRHLEALSGDGALPQGLAARHPTFGTPTRAVVLTTFVTLLGAMFMDFSALAAFSSIATAVTLLATCLAVPFLSKSPEAQAGGMRLPGGWLIPILASLTTIGVMIAGGLQSMGLTLGILAAGYLWRAVTKLRS